MSRAERAPTRPRRLIGFFVSLAIGLPLAVLFSWPQAFGAQRAPVIAQLISFRAPLALGLAVVAVIAGIIALLRHRWGVSAAMAMVLSMTAAANGAVLLQRGSSAELPEGDLTVVAWNTQGGATSPADVARLVLDVDADIVSLPETDEHAAAEIVRILAAGGVRMTPDTTRADNDYSGIPTTVLIAEALGEYRIDAAAGSTPGLPSAVWRPVEGTGPTIVGAHPLPPLFAHREDWDAGLRWIASVCDAPDVIVAGDLNATVDHMSGLGVDGALIGGCDDAALAAGDGATGTWPSDAPTWAAAPIDHVLIGSAWTSRGARVITSFNAGSDHRPIVTVLDER